MKKAMNWKTEGPASPKGAQASLALREAALDHRLKTLREVALALLNFEESLRRVQPPPGDNALPLSEQVKRFEIDLIRTALERTNNNQARAAQLLGVKASTLNTKIKRYRISVAGSEPAAVKNVQRRQSAA